MALNNILAGRGRIESMTNPPEEAAFYSWFGSSA